MNKSRFLRTLELKCQFKFIEREREFFGVLSQENLEYLVCGMRGVYIGKGFRVSLNGFSMWDKGSEKLKVWKVRKRVRTTK